MPDHADVYKVLLALKKSVLRVFSSSPSGPVFRKRWAWIPLVTVALSTLVIRFFEFDLRAQQWIYEEGGGSWALGEHFFWQTLYHYGTIPALILTLGAIAGYALSWSRAGFKKWRRVMLFVILTAVTGPGLVTNLALKENWGRPRPREVEGLGGHYAFEPVLTIDRESEGKSFPCGHATMGFLFMGGFFLFRRYHVKIAWWFLIGGGIGGTLTGIARMMQGGHFLSDVVWAGAVCWFVPMGLCYALGLHRELLKSSDLFEKTPKWILASTWAIGGVLFVAAMIATPFSAKRNLPILNEEAKVSEIQLELYFKLGDIDLLGADSFRITGEAYGHGVPTSKLAAYYEERKMEDHWALIYVDRVSGWIAEVNQQLKVQFPIQRTRGISIRTGEAKVWINLFDPRKTFEINILEGGGEVHLVGHQIPYELIDSGEKTRVATVTGAEPEIVIHLHEAFVGELFDENGVLVNAARAELTE